LDVARRFHVPLAYSRNSYVPALAGIVNMQEPDATTLELPVQALRNFMSRRLPSNTRNRPIQSVADPLPMNDTVSVPPGELVVGLAVREAVEA